MPSATYPVTAVSDHPGMASSPLQKRRRSDAKSSSEVLLEEAASILSLSPDQIDQTTSFLQHGGQSLSAVKLSKACRKRGCRVSVEQILKAGSIAQLMQNTSQAPKPLKTNLPQSPIDTTSKLRSPLLARSPIALRNRRLSEGFPELPTSPISPVLPAHTRAHSVVAEDDLREAPLSEMQLSLVHGSMANPGSNVIRFYETYNKHDLPLIKSAWRQLVYLEPIFRYKVSLEGASGVFKDTVEPSFDWLESVVHKRADYDNALSLEPKELLLGSSFRVITYEPAAISTIVWRVHHAMIDGYSANLVHQKLRAILNGWQVEAGTPFLHVARGLQTLNKASQNLNNQFWKDRGAELSEAAGALALAKPSQSIPGVSQRIGSITTHMPVNQLSDRAKSSQVSLAAIYYASWALTLSAFTDSDSVVFGTILSGRNIAVDGALDTVGPLINTLPLVLAIDKSWTTSELLWNVFERMVALTSVHTSTPANGFQRDFSSALAMEFELEFDVNDVAPRPLEESHFKVASDIPLSITFHSNGDIRFDYHRDAYQMQDIKLLSQCFRNALAQLLEPSWTVDQCLRQIAPLSDHEKVLSFGNGGSFDTFPQSVKDDLVTLFEKAAIAHPDMRAIEKGDASLTYCELDQQASALAWQLLPFVRDGDVVCVHADRSINWVVAIYGILKAGGVYSPLDAALPANIRAANFQTARAKVFLTPSSSQKTVAPEAVEHCFSIEELLATSGFAHVPHRTTVAPQANAYICFTSGSTGKPKGVVCHHEGLVAFQRDPEVRLMANPGVRVSQLMSPAFDGSIHEIFSTLSYGATLVLAYSVDPFAHLTNVNSAIMTPSVAKTLEPEDYPELRSLYLVGEPVQQWVNDTWALRKRLYNMYGPTEATGGATIKRCLPNKPVTIGPPNPSSRVYILDRDRRLSPSGVVGEIYLAGVQVARGYVGRPEETAKRFLPDPFHNGQYMYMTGDRGHFNSAGEINVLGRRDRQIKLRGFRCDLNDLEARIAQIEGVTAVGVAQKEDFLVAMIQPANLDYQEIKRQLTDVLPVHAVPRDFSIVDSFPKTPIGKLDYKKMIELVRPPPTTLKAKPLVTSTEKAIAAIWQDCLGIGTEPPLSPDSSFKALGGNSILQLLMLSRLSKKFGRHIPFKVIVQSPTLGGLAGAIDVLESSPELEPEALALPLGESEPSYMEIEWLEKFQLKTGTSAFNVTFACELGKSMDKGKLETALNKVFARHDILRCRFTRQTDGKLSRTFIYNPPKVQRLKRFDVWRESHRVFDHATDYPMFALMSNEQLLLNISHIICDLTTLESLLTEVATLYQGGTLVPVEHTFFESSWSKPARAVDLDFWSKCMEDRPGSPFATSDLPATRSSYSGTTDMSKMPKDLCHQMISYSQNQGITLHQLALAAVATALSADSDTTDVILGGPFLNRSAEHLNTVGLFLEPLPIRVQYDPKSNSAVTQSLPEAVQAASQAALAHTVPWNQLLKHLEVEASFPNHPLMDTMVTVHDDRKGVRLGLDEVEPLMTWTSGAKFTLMCEVCVASDDICALRLEYDDQIIGPNQIEEVRARILTALDCMTKGMSYSQMKEKVVDANMADRWNGPQTGFFYGKSLKSL